MTTPASTDHRASVQQSAHALPLEHAAPTPAPPMAPAPSRTPASRLGPEEDFPEDLAGLAMQDLQVLHSKITRQLDHEYLTDPTGPDVTTLDRCEELRTELDARDRA